MKRRPAPRGLKKGPKTKYPYGPELSLRASVKAMWKPVRALVQSDRFLSKLGQILARYSERKDDLFDELDELGDLFAEEADVAILSSWRQAINVYARRVEAFNKAQMDIQTMFTVGTKIELTERDIGVQRELFTRRSASLINGVTADQRKRISDAVLGGIQGGARPETIKANILESVDISERRATLIARDQLSSYNGSLTQKRMVANGVEKFEWSTALDERVRDSHAELEGQIFEWANLPTVDGQENVYPGLPINCRCVAVAVIDNGPDDELTVMAEDE